MEIKKDKIVYEDFLKIRKRKIKAPNGDLFERESLIRGEASAVLVYNEDTKKIIFTNQYRDAINGMSLEIPAGMLDSVDEDPKQCAVREVLEETGYKVSVFELIPLVKTEPAPGYTNELIHVFMAVVNNDMKETEGGGLESENEYIEIVEMGVNKAIEKLHEGEITDAKSIIAIHLFKMKNIN